MPSNTIDTLRGSTTGVPRAFYVDDAPPLPPVGDPHRREWYQPPARPRGALPRWVWPVVAASIGLYGAFLFVLAFVLH